MTAPATHVFAWGNNGKRATLKNRPLRIITSGAKQSCLVEFTDNGQREVVSRRSLRKVAV
jgi:hypothetical protein